VTGTKTETIGGIPAVTKRLTGRVDNSAWPQITVAIDMTLTTPAHAAGPVPVIMELAFSEEFMTTVAQTSIPRCCPGAGKHRTTLAAAGSGAGMGLCDLEPNLLPGG